MMKKTCHSPKEGKHDLKFESDESLKKKVQRSFRVGINTRSENVKVRCVIKMANMNKRGYLDANKLTEIIASLSKSERKTVDKYFEERKENYI